MKLTLPPVKLPPVKLPAVKLPPVKFTLPRLRLTPIAAAALIPSALVGIACSVAFPLSGGPPAAALAANVTARSAAHAVSHPRTPAKHAAPAPAAQPTAAAAQPAPQPPAASQPAGTSQAGTGTAATSSQPLTAGMSPYEQCVAWRESSDTPTDPDGLFGILPYIWQSLGYSGTAGQASVAQQEAAFNQLYAQYGTQPWSPSDGC